MVSTLAVDHSRLSELSFSLVAWASISMVCVCVCVSIECKYRLLGVECKTVSCKLVCVTCMVHLLHHSFGLTR
jgi:hypothetical protein